MSYQYEDNEPDPEDEDTEVTEIAFYIGPGGMVPLIPHEVDEEDLRRQLVEDPNVEAFFIHRTRNSFGNEHFDTVVTLNHQYVVPDDFSEGYEQGQWVNERPIGLMCFGYEGRQTAIQITWREAEEIGKSLLFLAKLCSDPARGVSPAAPS